MLLIHLKAGESMPPLARLDLVPPLLQKRAETLFSGTCKKHAVLAEATAPTDPRLLESIAAQEEDMADVGEMIAYHIAQKRIGRTLGYVVRGREEFGLGNISERETRPHVRSWQSYTAFEDDDSQAHPA